MPSNPGTTRVTVRDLSRAAGPLGVLRGAAAGSAFLGRLVASVRRLDVDHALGHHVG